MDSLHPVDPAAADAVRLRARLRALTVGQAEAFDLLYRHFGANSAMGARLVQSSNRLPYLAVLLGDLAWVHGEHQAHEGSLPSPAMEAAAVTRVCPVSRHPTSPHRQRTMTPEQRAAVLVYLDALLVVASSCIALEDQAPSLTLGREARRFLGDIAEVRKAAAF